MEYQEFCDFLKPGILDTLYGSKGKCWCLLTELTINNPLPAPQPPHHDDAEDMVNNDKWQEDGQSGAVKLIKVLVRKVKKKKNW